MTKNDAREFLFLRRLLHPLSREKEKRLDVMLLNATANTAKKALIVLLDDTGTESVLYCKVGMSHLLKIHQDLQVNWDSWQTTLKQSGAMWYFSTTRKKRHFWQLRNGDQILKSFFFPLKRIWNIKLSTGVTSLLKLLKSLR